MPPKIWITRRIRVKGSHYKGLRDQGVKGLGVKRLWVKGSRGEGVKGLWLKGLLCHGLKGDKIVVNISNDTPYNTYQK